MHKKLLLVILDGFGIYKNYPGNAVALAKMPTYDQLWRDYPHAQLEASGEAVGLTVGQIGSSEVGHPAIGSGRVLYQDLVKIKLAIKDGSFAKNEAFVAAFDHAKKNNSTLHVMGLLSPGGVHSHQDHIFALLRSAHQSGVQKIYLHAFTDGRDVAPKSCEEDSFKPLAEVLKETGTILASISGRYYGMDRDHNWDRIDLAFDALTKREGLRAKNYQEAIANSYAKDENDEFIKPTLIDVSDENAATIKENDALIFTNFRSDRTRQLTERFLEKGPKNLFFATMTQYKEDYQVEVAFAPQTTDRTLGEVLSENKLKQLRITETQKFAHLTFFFNCKREEPYPLEDRFMFDSNKEVTNFDEDPAMRAIDIGNKIAETMKKGDYDVIFTNLCNGDMVGHTGNIPAAVKSLEAVDQALTAISSAAKENGYTILITADHGNCEEMLGENGEMNTAHTINPVPFILVDQEIKELNRDHGILADIAPTMLKLLEIKQPVEMTGESLV
jgi:2,3-bisphosphoglycerate-independent phosphoglycerate mutase